MTETPIDLTGLVGSRICHDLISPLGAISNGVELLGLTKQADGPEMDLISQSVESAKARIRFFRVSFGTSEAGQVIAGAELKSILADFSKSGRSDITWAPSQPTERQVAKLAFLLILCLETAMPYGGRIMVEEAGGTWTLRGITDKLAVDAQVWSGLTNPQGAMVVKASDVHFGLIPDLLARMQTTLTTEFGHQSIEITF